MNELLMNIMGWTAMILILAAYFLITKGKVNARSFSYQLLNLIGAVLFIIYLSFLEAWASVALNVIWALIALGALIPILSNRKSKDAGTDDKSD